VTFGQRFARFVTDVVVRRPALWRLFRVPMRRQFDRLAPSWETIRRPDFLAPLEAALDRLPTPPKRMLDIGTGTGAAARLAASRYPEADVIGADVSERMLDEARRLTDSTRVTYRAADAELLPSGSPIGEVSSLRDRIAVTAGPLPLHWVLDGGSQQVGWESRRKCDDDEGEKKEHADRVRPARVGDRGEADPGDQAGDG